MFSSHGDRITFQMANRMILFPLLMRTGVNARADKNINSTNIKHSGKKTFMWKTKAIAGNLR